MKLVNPKYFEPIEINEENPQTLIIENNRLFRKAVFEMISQCENSVGEYVLSEENDIINFGKQTMVITDLFSMNFELKQIKTKINQVLIEDVDDEIIREVISKLNELGTLLCSTVAAKLICPRTDLSKCHSADLTAVWDG